ncbi:MAG: inositol monophosphatase [Deltaproteobacteria bacterium]|nr:MAG: inositol monophosphatase [Deltaproteobacteria bacterium]
MAHGDSRDIKELQSFAMEAVRTAGEKALGFYGKGRRDVRFDEALVTEAELVLNDFFREQLSMAFPDHQIFTSALLEEGYTHEEKRYVWVYDPLDGVSNFQAGIPIWGVSLALLENFWPLLGCFFMPCTGEFFHAIAGQAAYCSGQVIGVPEREMVNDESVLLVFSRFHNRFRSSFPGKMLNLGCTSAHVCYVARGGADAAVLANETYQDLAASRVILEAAGGRFYHLDGKDIFLNEYLEGERIDIPLLATGPELCRAIGPHLSRV